MAFNETGKIWFNGEFVDWKDANIHVLSHVVHYGSSVFEGIRCYNTKKGPAVFRLREHVQRLLDSGKIYRMNIPYTADELCSAIIETIKINNLNDCYIRPVVFRGYHELGVYPLNCPLETVIAAWKWGKYLGEEAIEKGVDLGVSSWRRMAPNTLPNMAKAGANYMNSQLAKMESVLSGFDEAIMLDYGGVVSEGSGENIFLLKDDVLYTPHSSLSILSGITRDSVIKLAMDEGIKINEEPVPREMLYLADEIFLTGTAAEITPVRSVDHIEIGSGKRGPVTEMLQNRFFDIARGACEDKFDWLTFVE
ncbi:MAG: branched-chain-amino-acid transaminase [Methanobacterium sp.]|jgi:branched-chain amino acid aminotransferase